ncbi:ankyrin repeat domain-containing protein [Janthinobacterium sp. 64]|uniref:ankyrin repeat domain-containing protein n=1 Tax=Janthinobacterium sp. 64 TaxID=2035208 RepID=UPI000C2C2FDD|nr:ankyrin repeat domain-containing protein [Janthinobacterium sp. 64]
MKAKKTMATIPSFEALLLEIHQSLDLGPYSSKVKDKFANLGMRNKNHKDMAANVCGAIFNSLDMDAAACRDAVLGMSEWEGYHKAVELNTWTSNADQHQVVWHLLGYCYVPALARRIAFWNLDGAFDKGMPGGAFWFLPHVNITTGTMELPVPHVVDWLIDLLDCSIGKAGVGTGLPGDDNTDRDSIVRNLHNWKNASIPRVHSINGYFSDGAKLVFKGVFELAEDLADDAKFEAALAFIQFRNLSADDLRDQIPMTQPGRLEAIMDESATDEEKQLFVQALLTRYAKPGMAMIRQRLRVARMVQDGYIRLLKFLCPGVQATCTDPSQNKLLQLAGIFGTVYNLTVDAWKNSDTQDEEDILFESRLAPWDKADIFLSILPSIKNERHLPVADLLTRRFAKLADGDALEDLVALDMHTATTLIASKCRRLKEEHEENMRLHSLLERVRTASPWRALQGEASYAVVSHIANSTTPPAKTRLLAMQRLRELAATPAEMVGAIVLELAELLNCPHTNRPSDVRQQVEALLADAETSAGHTTWKAPLLQYRAKHLLAQNAFDDAAKLMRAALEACNDGNFGTLRGEIARDAFAIEVANLGLIPANHEKYHRNMLAYGMFQGQVTSLEDTAVWVSEYFWDDLYKPYPGMESVQPLAKKQAEAFIQEALPVIIEGNWDALKQWMKHHAKTLKQGTIREVRSNTVLMAWLKMQDEFARQLPILRAAVSSDLQGEISKVEKLVAHWRHAIHLLVEAWPKQVNMADFKGQTPLMMVADASDEQLTLAFLNAGADVNAQDYLGRTALHAAVTARSKNCVSMLLTHQADTSRVTYDEANTALHTAARMGYADIVALVIEHHAHLVAKENSFHQTPLELAKKIMIDLPGFRNMMATHHRRSIGSTQDFDQIIAMLTDTACDDQLGKKKNAS